MTVRLVVRGDGIQKLAKAAKVLGTEGKARRAYSIAINDTGKVAGNEAGRALSDQTGLPKSTGRKAMRRKVTRSSPATLTYEIEAKGGPISMRYFKPRETKRGVSAAPYNARKVFPSTFMRAGWWPKRVTKKNWNKQVFRRGRLSKGFEKVRSGVVIPVEAVKGETAKTFLASGPRLQKRVEHIVSAMAAGVFSSKGKGRFAGT